MSAPRRRFLIVDGHSMVFSWDDLRALHEERPAMARELLARRLTTYQDVKGERVVLVFDGKRGGCDHRAAPSAEHGIQIIYSGGSGSADAIIERLAARYGEEQSLTVASRDRAVLDAAAASGADCLSAQGLREEIERAEGALGDMLNRRQR